MQTMKIQWQTIQNAFIYKTAAKNKQNLWKTTSCIHKISMQKKHIEMTWFKFLYYASSCTQND